MKKNYKKLFSTAFSFLFLLGASAQVIVDFETAPPTGVTFYQSENDDPGFIQTTSKSHSGSSSYYHNDDNLSTTSDSWMVMPVYTCGANDEMKVWYNQVYTTTYYNYSGVWISTSSDDPIANPNDFTELQEFNASAPGGFSESTWTEYVLNMASYSGQTIYIAFKYSGDWDFEFYVDDFSLDAVPTCPAPTALTTSNVTSSSVDLTWTTGGAANWNIEYGPAGFTQGTGTFVPNAGNPFTISSLTQNTDYDVYVQDSCGQGDVSTWVGTASFHTDCAILTAPYTESFDGTSIPQCWSMFGAEDWLFGGIWPDYGASNILDHTGNSGNWAGVDGSSGSNSGVTLETPSIDVSALTDPAIEFYYFSNNTNEMGDNNELEVNVWDGASWNLMRTIAEDNADWVKHTVVLSNLTITGPIQVQFVVNQTATITYHNDQFIDDVSILEAPTCPAPYGFSELYQNEDSVVLSWTAGLNETMWNVEYGTVGFAQGSGTMQSGLTSTTDTIDGLALGSVYEFYVQADCGGGDASDWVGPITVITPITNDSTCDAIAINVDGVNNVFSNVGATTQTGELDGYNTVWFTAVVPASGHIYFATCGSTMDTRLYAYSDTTDCSDFSTFAQIASNDDACGAQSIVQICGQTPGATLWFSVSTFSSSTSTGLITVSAGDLGLSGYAGQGAAMPVSACAGDTVDLWSNLTGQLTNNGTWTYPSNTSAIVDDTTVNTGAFSLVGNEVYYIVANNCDADTATVVINAQTVTNTGTAVANYTECNAGDVFLFNGLTGTVDAGGTWSDDTQTSLLVNNKFVASGVNPGAYQFTYTISGGVCPPASTQVTVNLVDCTNITEEGEAKFTIYPNPNNGTFFISNGGNASTVAMQVVDVQGKVVYTNSFNLTAGAQQEISLGNVETGVYLVRVVTNNKVINNTVIVK